MPATITGAQVRAWRHELRLSQVAIARALGYSRSAVNMWERRGALSIPRYQYDAILGFIEHERAKQNSQAASIQKLSQ